MHSSRIHTARSRNRWGVCLSACWDTHPPGCGPGEPPGVGLETPWVLAWRSPWVLAWRPPWPDPSTSPWKPARHAGIPPLPGDLLQGMLGYHLQPAMHAGIPPPPTEADPTSPPREQNHRHV